MKNPLCKRLTIIASLGVLVSILVWEPLFGLLQGPPSATPATLELPPAPPVQEEARRPSIEEVRRLALKRVRPALEQADRDCQHAIGQHLRAVDRFFQDAKKGTGAFADEALGWGGKRQLIGDYLPWNDGRCLERFLHQQFRDHVLAPEDLEMVLVQVVKSYFGHMRDAESRMLVDLQLDLADLPIQLDLATLTAEELQERMEKAIRQAQLRVGSELRADVTTEMVSLIIGEVLAAAAIRLGVSGGILTAGASSSWATFGIGIIVGLIVDQIVSWVWDWWADPRGELSRELDRKLDEVHQAILNGDSKNPGLRECLEKLARSRSHLRREAIQQMIRQSEGQP